MWLHHEGYMISSKGHIKSLNNNGLDVVENIQPEPLRTVDGIPGNAARSSKKKSNEWTPTPSTPTQTPKIGIRSRHLTRANCL